MQVPSLGLHLAAIVGGMSIGRNRVMSLSRRLGYSR